MSLSNVGILIFDDVEVLDFCGPFEVFSVASKPGLPRHTRTINCSRSIRSPLLPHRSAPSAE